MGEKSKFARRTVLADLIEATPPAGALGYWLLASPLLGFLGWLWIDLFRLISPLPWYWLNVLLGVILYIAVIVLPFGYLAHLCVLALPRLFHHAGWEVQPLEPVASAEQYMVRYAYKARHRAANSWRRTWLRAAQGWVYLEIAAIFVGAIGMILLFFSAVEFGFGQ
jgi:hypothetical protein